MSLQSLDYKELPRTNCALSDSTSILLLCDPTLSLFLTSSESCSIFAQGLPARLAGYAAKINSVLDVIARMSAYDFLVVDRPVLESAARAAGLQSASPLGHTFLRSTEVPDDVYRVAAANVFAAVDVIRFDPRSSHWFSEAEFHDAIEARLVDERLGHLRDFSWLRNSDQSAARALLYSEIARHAQVPLFLSPAKEHKLDAIGRSFMREALKIVESTVDRSVLASLYKEIQEAYGGRFEFEWPPLVRYIVAIAHRHEISIFEALLRVRDLPAATAFRSWLGQLQRRLLTNASVALMEVNRAIAELTAISEQWGKECSAEYGIRYRQARANLEAIPGIGTVLKLAGRADLVLKDPILNTRVDYLAFIADWYSEISETH